MKPNKTTAILLVTVLSIGMAMGMTACAKKAKSSAKSGLTESGAAGNGGKTSTDGATPASGTATGGMAQTTGTAGASGEGGSAGGSGTGGSGAGGTGGSAVQTTGKTMKVKILWWNDTGQRAPSNAEVVYGSSVYKPKPGKSDVGVVAGLPIGKPVEMVIYPDGRSGKKMTAKVQFSATMLANSDRDAIHVEVKDGGVRVLGNPVIDFIQSFSR